MITPKQFVVEDFIPPDEKRVLSAIKSEALTGSELIDNLILLDFCDTRHVQQVLKEKYGMAFTWLNFDPTPEEFKAVAEKHHILIEKGRSLIVYIPLCQEVDDAMLQIDIPSYQIGVCFIADCNLKILRTGLPKTLLSRHVADFRPILVLKRLIMDCISKAGTDLHLASFYLDKQPAHKIQYRIKRELVDSPFQIDLNMIEQIVQAAVHKLSPHSVMDVDAATGVTTDIRDLVGDATVDIRTTITPDDAGYYAIFTIQTIQTTTKKIHELGFSQTDVDTLRQLAQRRTGLTLVTGKMRTGKNTTIFAMLNELEGAPIRIVEYSNPIENHMFFPQYNYGGDVKLLKEHMKMAKKMDIDIAVLNEIPNSEVAFAVRDLVNSAVGVITTTHVDRAWHLPNKLREFFAEDYKTIISQLNAVVNQKMFRKWSGPNMQKRTLVKEHGEFEMFCYAAGVRQYFVPEDISKVTYELQPLVEILIITDSMKTSILNFDEIWRAEQMMKLQLQQQHATLENKCAALINSGQMSLEEMRQLC